MELVCPPDDAKQDGMKMETNLKQRSIRISKDKINSKYANLKQKQVGNNQKNQNFEKEKPSL